MNLGPAWDKLEQIARGFLAALPNIGVGLLLFAGFYLVGQVVRRSVRTLNERSRHRQNLGLVLGRLAQAGMMLLGLLVALMVIFPSFKAADLIQLLGIGSVAIGFAFRDILQNFLAGILILLTEPFRIDDQIRFKEFEGTVEDIHTRATTVRTYDGRRVVIPNAELFTNAVAVNTAFERRRLEYDIGIGYGDQIDEAKAVILTALTGIDGVLAETAPDVLVVALEASSVNLRVRWWVTPPRRADALELQDRVLTAVKTALTGHGIDLPFPTQQILFHDQTEETDGDRARQREGWPVGRHDAPRARTIAGALRDSARPKVQDEARNGHAPQ